MIDGELAGFASAGPTRDDDDPHDVGELYTIYLLPVAWGRGLGAALLDTAQADLARRRHRTMTIWVLEGNTRARRFYEKYGFVEVGPYKFMVGEQADEDIIMRASL